MLFTDANFVYFILVLFSAFYFKPIAKYQPYFLIFGSLFFYYSNSPSFTILLLFSAAFNVLFSWLITKSDIFEKRKLYVTIGVSLNVFVLVFFKYGFMLVSSVFHENTQVYSFFYRLALPIGVSFYTFEGISLLVDTYKARNKQDYTPIAGQNFFSHLRNVMLFISFFPHLIAGPILRANHFFPQVRTKYFKDINFTYCFKKLVLGYFLKMVVANNLQNFTFWLQRPSIDAYSSFTLFILVLGFTFQLFADFAGYSYIALGLAGLFGYQLEDNFSFPFASTSFSELWRRWHMTLSSFLRYYVYTNLLGGGRKGKFASLFNIFFTMVIAGLWHGAQWTFALWGALHGLALVVEHFVKRTYKTVWKRKLNSFSGWVLSFCFVIIPSMVLFRFPSLHAVNEFAYLFFHNTHIQDNYNIILYILLYGLPIIIMHIFYVNKHTGPVRWLFQKNDYLVYGPMLFFIIMNSAQSYAFIYFKF